MKLKQLFFLLFFFSVFSAFSQTKVILLGTGTPNPDPAHSGSSLAILVNDTPYLVDFGAGIGEGIVSGYLP